jgi:hypothetical protein
MSRWWRAPEAFFAVLAAALFSLDGFLTGNFVLWLSLAVVWLSIAAVWLRWHGRATDDTA